MNKNLSVEFVTKYSESRALSAKSYFEWLRVNGIIELLLRPYTVPSICYDKKWDSSNQHFIEEIFQYLTTFQILSEAGGTYKLTDNYLKEVTKLEHIIELGEHKHPTQVFIKHGLKILDDKLMGDSGQWDLNKDSFIFERGLTQSVYESRLILLQDVLFSHSDFTIQTNPKVIVYANYIEVVVPLLEAISEKIDSVSIIVPNNNIKDEAISFCETKEAWSTFSAVIFSEPEFSEQNKKADLVIIPNGLGFYSEFKNQLKFLKNITNYGSTIIGFAATDAHVQLGIEPLFSLHPFYHGLPNTSDFNRVVKANGFLEPKRLDPKNLIFITKVG